MKGALALGMVLAAVLAGAGAGWADGRATSPRPLPRPWVLHPTALAVETALAEAAATLETQPPLRRPKPRPGRTEAVISEAVGKAARRPEPRPLRAPVTVVVVAAAAPRAGRSLPRPEARPEEFPAERGVEPRRRRAAPETRTRKGSVCGDPEIRGSEIAPIDGRLNGCGLADGVQVTAVDGLVLSTPAILDCPTARALKAWVSKGVKPAVGRLGGGAAGLKVAASYSCRSRNNQPGAQISEHGRGHAIDISAIILKNGVAISVLDGWGEGRHGKILKAVRAAACGPFGTVLGPGSDRFHRDHLHMDTARHRSGAYCR